MVISISSQLRDAPDDSGYHRNHDTDEMTNEQTILSSRSGNATIPAPEGVVMMATPAHFYSGQISLSTEETQSLPCEAFHDDDDDDNNGHDTEMDLIATINSESSGSDDDLESLQNHDSVVEQATSHQDKTWYDRLVSDSDWEEFRIGAHTVLKAILKPNSEKNENRLLPLPPNPPTTDMLLFASTDHPKVLYSAKDHVAPEIVCQICNDVMVGAMKLDCECSSGMVCASCWDEGEFGDPAIFDKEREECSTRRSPEYAERMDFVWVENSKQCPCCQKRVQSTTTCHALDVAILHIVRDLTEAPHTSLPADKAKISSLKQNYYSRLAAWRSTVYEKNEIRCRREAARHEELLARLIQEEERVIWKENNAMRHTREAACRVQDSTATFLGQAAIVLLAAAMASIGIHSLRR
jgi:hypothetical protein